ncbi:MAG: C40 family peptidase [Phenylobacterium sp.]|uniref:C40 family peptidase n=1 Tax=Phenylobacterium sp. TaxID=1871053 RepID=UPI00271CB618|nr:C40 family peptidase [Phenylobacterium sp.]MDO8902870.1 C40 family peptidase [Phenylobacterium sp.]MDP2215378.1 C40 family peptidase [Phenylobacterium sp.]
MSRDPRLTLARPDLAAVALEGRVAAERYAAPTPRACRVAATAIRTAPASGAEQADQLLFGETFDVLDEADGFAWGQARRDGYVGYVDLEALGVPVLATHWVRALRTYGFEAPSIKSPALGPYSQNALVSVVETEGRFVRDRGGAWFVAAHLAPVGLDFASDPAGVAERYLETPYLWGGRESLGLDCSGLVMQARLACGLSCPRDTDQQEAAFTQDADPSALRRGDLVFWRGHVAMMLSPDQMIHANAHHMAVAIEPLNTAIARIEAAGSGEPTSYRRP